MRGRPQPDVAAIAADLDRRLALSPWVELRAFEPAPAHLWVGPDSDRAAAVRWAADHNRAGAYEADLSGEHDRLNGGPAQVAAAVGTEDRAAVMDSMILCKFLRGVFDDRHARIGGGCLVAPRR